MGKHLKILLIGLLISFLGSLPFGTLNITAFQIAAFQNLGNALMFALGVVLIELIVVRITLRYTKSIGLENKAFLYLMPLAIVVLLYLSFSSFGSLYQTQELGAGSNLVPMIESSFLLGLLLSILNPMHFPFWMGWNGFLTAKKTLNNNTGMYSAYILGIGIGSLSGLSVFIFTGKYIFQNYHQYAYIIAFAMGCLYLGFSLYLMFLLYKNHFKLIIP